MGKNYEGSSRPDPTHRGPIHNRSCTDIVWLVVFIVFLGLWGFVGYHSLTNGSIDKLLAPMDSDNNLCGIDSGYKNKKFLVYFNIFMCLLPGSNPIMGCQTPSVCVEKCPTEIVTPLQLLSNFDEYKSQMICKENIDTTSLTRTTADKYIMEKKCASFMISSKPVLGRCFMDIKVNIYEIISTLDTSISLKPDEQSDDEILKRFKPFMQFNQISSQILHDLVNSRWWLSGGMMAIVVICFIYIFLLRWMIKPIFWTSIVSLFAVLFFALNLCYKQYEYYKNHPVSSHSETISLLESYLCDKNTWLAVLAVVGLMTFILVIIIIFLRRRIAIAIALIQEGSKAVTAIKATVLFPIFPWILQCTVIAYALYVFMHIVSINDPFFRIKNLQNDSDCECTSALKLKDLDSCNPFTFPVICYDKNKGFGNRCPKAYCRYTGFDSWTSAVNLHAVNTLGLFWGTIFISGVADMMLASTFATWYWTFRKNELPFFTLTDGMFRVIRYHLGTVAFGSFILALVRIIRIILEYTDKKLKKYNNPLTRCIMCCMKCFLWCLDKFIKFINKNAFIMCAIKGNNLCTSARHAFSLLMRNMVRAVVLDKVMEFIFFLSKLLLSIGVGLAMYYIMEWNNQVSQGEKLNYSYVPAVILAISTYIISIIFFKVYTMAVDTLFLCFLEDCEVNDGSPEKPYFMSKTLLKILSKRNQQE